jgi:hypothetical protein
MTQHKTVGRNDPCPCGSGKKYKRCCLAKDQQHAAEERRHVPQPDEDAAPFQAPDVRQIPAMLQALTRKSSRQEDRAGFQDLLAQTKPILDYMEREPAIEAASQAIQAQRTEFERLAADQAAYLERTNALFAEERFAPLRFTADDIARAFAKVGKPISGLTNDDFVATVRKAILHLADKDWRNRSAMSLLLHLPDYVAAGRPLDAWIIQYCSYLTREETEESNPFLFQMFSYGYDGWVAEQRAREVALLGELGVDMAHLEQMSMEELEAWVQDQQADPAKLARMEKLLSKNPEQRIKAQARMQELERDAHRLLERPDAAHLLLSPDEMQPWLPKLLETFANASEQFPEIAGPAPNAADGKAFLNAMLPPIREMVAGLFTPQRLAQLAAQLKTYRNDLFNAGDKKTAELANGALLYVKDEDEPDCNRFLCALGYLSVIQGLGTMAAPAPEQAPASDESED